MSIVTSERVPNPGESLALYVRRVRTELRMSQVQVVEKAGIHLQSLGKIEAGKTSRLAAKTKTGLARALQVPQEYLEAVCQGVSVSVVQQLKICSNCWMPGTEAELMWLDARSKYCFACGKTLQERCANCNELITSLKHRFCPMCGQAYKG